MSTFSNRFTTCTRGSGLPVPELDNLVEAKELIEHVHSVWETF